MYSPQQPEQGLTLIETMIALAIFAIGSLGILAILMTGFSTSAEGNNLTGGYQIAQNALGLIRANGSNALQFNGAAYHQQATSPFLAAPTPQLHKRLAPGKTCCILQVSLPPSPPPLAASRSFPSKATGCAPV